MTREEIKNIPELVDLMLDKYILADSRTKVYKRLEEVCDLAIKAVEQEPCDDAISREAVRDTIFAECSAEKLDIDFAKILLLQRAIKALPPVTPQPKMGKWIKSRDSYGNNHFTCPFCKHDIATKYAGTWDDNYCSNCGAKMQEVEE